MSDKPEIQKGLLRHSIFMFVATQAANVANLLFQVVTGRHLPTEEYGVLAAMLSIYLVMSTPMDALRTAMAHFTTRAMRTGDTGVIRWIVKSWCWKLLILTGILVGIGYFGQTFAAEFFQLESGLPFLFVCCLISGTFFLLLFSGVFQGMQNFYWMSASMHVWTFVRLGFVIAFMALAPTAISGLVAHGLATMLGIFLSLVGLHVLTRTKPLSQPSTGIGGFFIRSLLMLGSYAVLMNADLIFVKHYFTPEEAGVFARAATIGRSVIFLPMPIALVMFPKVITTGPSTRDSRITLLKALGMVVLLIGSAVGVTIAAPWLPLWIIYGIREPDAEMVRLLILVVCAMAPLSLTFLLMNYEIAQHRFSMTTLLMICAVCYIAGVVLWNDTMLHVVYVLAAVSVISALGFSASILWRAGKRHHADRKDETTRPC